MENDMSAYNVNDERSILYIDDPELYISSKEMIDAIKPMDAAIDIIGVVKVINEPITKVKGELKYTIFNFEVECQPGILVPIAVWDEEIKRIKSFIILNHIIHIDSPFARPQEPKYSKNGKDYILTCRSNTTVNNLGKLKTVETEFVETCVEYSSIVKSIADMSSNTNIALLVYLKTEFRKDGAHNLRGIGVVTDGSVKLTVYIRDFDENIFFVKGEHLKIIGKFNNSAKQPYFEIPNVNNIYQLNDEKMLVETLRKAVKSVKQEMSEFLNTDKTKKIRLE